MHLTFGSVHKLPKSFQYAPHARSITYILRIHRDLGQLCESCPGIINQCVILYLLLVAFSRSSYPPVSSQNFLRSALRLETHLASHNEPFPRLLIHFVFRNYNVIANEMLERFVVRQM